MSSLTINAILTLKERFNIYTLMCSHTDLPKNLAFIESERIFLLNIGKELSTYISSIDDYSYLNIDVHEYVIKLLNKKKSRVSGTDTDVIAIYNLGILFEPALELNAVKLLKEFSKSAALIIIWENQSDFTDRLNWPTQKDKMCFDFSGIQLKRLQYAI